MEEFWEEVIVWEIFEEWFWVGLEEIVF